MSGKVIWFEVVGENAGGLQAFYEGLFGWDLNPGPGWPDYGMIDPPEDGVGIPGAVGKAPGAGGAGWTTVFVHVDDIDAALARASALGAEVITPSTAVPDGSKIARVTDPGGHTLGLWQAPA